MKRSTFTDGETDPGGVAVMEPVIAKGVSRILGDLYYACKAAFTNCMAHVACMRRN